MRAGTTHYEFGSFVVDFTITNPGTPGYTIFSWTSNLGVDAVMVKDGVDGAFLYTYDGLSANADGAVLPNGFVRNQEEKTDSNLSTPDASAGGTLKNISHVSFCVDYEVIVEKTATTTFTRTYDWGINKTAAKIDGTALPNPIVLANDRPTQLLIALLQV